MMKTHNSSSRLVLGSSLAAVISTAALIGAAAIHEQPAGASISPFGWNRVVVIHSLSTLILSWWLAGRIWEQTTAIHPRRMLMIWGLIGLVLAALTFFGGVFLRPVIDALNAGFAVRLVTRVVWCMMLQVPWCLVGLATVRESEVQGGVKLGSLNVFGLGVVTALGVPLSFLAVFCEEQTRVARDNWVQTQLVDSYALVQRLYDVGSTSSLGERASTDGSTSGSVTPEQALADLQMAMQYVGHRIDQHSHGQLDDEGRLQLARDFLSLDRTDAAKDMLVPIAENHPVAAILLAEICKEQGDPAASRAWARKAMKVASDAAKMNHDAANTSDDVQLRAYDMLAVFAGEEGDFKAAEGFFLEALERIPSRAAEIHDRLGKHYEFLGELPRAIQHQQQAALLDPETFVPPDSLTQKVLSSGAPVGLARPKSSRYK